MNKHKDLKNKNIKQHIIIRCKAWFYAHRLSAKQLEEQEWDWTWKRKGLFIYLCPVKYWNCIDIKRVIPQEKKFAYENGFVFRQHIQCTVCWIYLIHMWDSLLSGRKAKLFICTLPIGGYTLHAYYSQLLLLLVRLMEGILFQLITLTTIRPSKMEVSA